MLIGSKKPAAKVKGKKAGNLAAREELLFYAFAEPWIIGLLVFFLYPAGMSFYYSLTNYDIISPPKFIAIQNYTNLAKDELFIKCIKNTLFMVAFSLPINLIVQLLLALMMNWRVKGIGLFRTIYYMPVLVPAVSTSILFTMVYDPDYGLLNALLKVFHIPPQQWLNSVHLSKPSIILMGIWTAGSGMLIYLANLKDIPEVLYESAEIDGANYWWRFWKITLPMLTPTIFFQLVMGIISTFQLFTESFVLTQGGPDYSTYFMMYYLYLNAFRYGRMGMASAMAWILFLMILIITVLILKSSPYWVHYEEERK
jgi:multiple sugar transport system permease protein